MSQNSNEDSYSERKTAYNIYAESYDNNNETKLNNNMGNKKREKPTKTEYVTGLITGMMFALCLTIVTFSYFIYTGKIKWNNDSEIKAAETISEDGSVILSKLQLMLSVIDANYIGEYKNDELIENIYKGFMDALGDKYSCYFTSSEYNEMVEETTGNYFGIGVPVIQDKDTLVITVGVPYEKSPGEKAGFKEGDILVAVDGIDVTGMTIDDVIKLIRGEEDTDVVVTVKREGEEKNLDLVATRAKMDAMTIAYEMLENKTGYVYVSGFDGVTVKQFTDAVEALKTQGMEKLIIDVRDNPGGLYTTVCSMLDYLLPKGLLVYTEDKEGNREESWSDDENSLNMPMAVLVNGNSASASEIFAAAIQDFDAGEVIGTTTYGKAVVQNLYPFTDGTAIKLTIARYYTPLGRDINEVGVEPDIVIELPKEVYQTGVLTPDNDTQLKAAIEALNK